MKEALLFEECLDISDPTKRSAHLHSACPECPQIREAVARLLRAHEASRDFLKGGTLPKPVELGADSGISVEDLEPGGRIGPYRLMGLIGEGSTSTVFLAEQEEPVHRWVALKIVKPGMDSRKVLLRFGLERQALALMDHPGIAKLLDAGATANGRPFFVMELVSGIAITQFCDEHKLNLTERLDLFIQVCNAVHHAHQRGIIHRDLKPDNILVLESEDKVAIKIIDFGIAKVLHGWGADDSGRTCVTPFLGTPAYMSPEQVQMTSSGLDTRTDVYSLGALLYEMLAGNPPFPPEMLLNVGIDEMCRIIRTVDPAAPSLHFSHLPAARQREIAQARATTPHELQRALAEDLDWIALKALEKPCDLRYPTTKAMADDLTRHREHRPVSAVAPSLAYRMSKLFKRRRKLVAVGGLVCLILMISALLTVFMAMNVQVSASQARSSEAATIAAQTESLQTTLAMHVSAGLSAADDLQIDRAVLWFANAARLAGPDDFQSEVNARRAIFWMSKVPFPVGALQLPSLCRQLEFSQDSRFLLVLAMDDHWVLWDARTGEPAPWAAGTGPIRTAAWSPHGSTLALVTTRGEVRVIEAGDGTLLHAFTPSKSPSVLGFTADARHLLYGDSTLYALDLASALPPLIIAKDSGTFLGLTPTNDPSLILATTTEDIARVIAMPGTSSPIAGANRTFPHQHSIRTESCSNRNAYQEDFLKNARLSLPVLLPGASRLLTRTGSFDITLWNPSTGDALLNINEVCCSCRFVASPEAGLMACGIQGGKIGIWDVTTGERVRMLSSQGACILDIAFGINGRCIISAEANGLARLWGIDNGRELQSPMHHSTDVDMVSIADDGQLVATGQSDGLVRIWRLVESLPEDQSPVKDEIPMLARIDPQGKNFVLTKEPGWDACYNQLSVYSIADRGRESRTLQFDGCVTTAAFSSDSSLLAVGVSAGGSNPARIDFINPLTLEAAGQSMALPSAPAFIAANPRDHAFAVVCQSGRLLVLDPDAQPMLRWSADIPNSPARISPLAQYSADGYTLVSLGPDGSVEIRDASTGLPRHPPLRPEPDGFWSFTLAADSRHMATTTMRGKVEIRDIHRGVATGVLLEHGSWVYRCRFSPDGSTLITATHDGKVRLWDWRTGHLIAGPMVHPAEVHDAALTPDNRYVLTACRDGKVRIWEPHSGRIIAPPVNVGPQAFNIDLTHDGRHAVIGGLGDRVFLLPLGGLHDPLPYNAEDLCLISEVISGCVIEDGALHDLSTGEWLDRYRRLRQLHPTVFRTQPVTGLWSWTAR